MKHCAQLFSKHGGIAGSKRRLRPAALWGSTASLCVVLALLVSACGGSSGNGSSSGTNSNASPLAYALCMRSHGVTNFPDPNSQGQFPPFQLDAVASAQTAQMAQTACQPLLPHGNSQPQPQQRLAQGLSLAKCMRKHGFPNFPDPKVSSGGAGTNFTGTGIDPNSPQFQTAQTTCLRRLAG